MQINSQSGGDNSVEVCPLRINEKAPTKSRGCQYADLCRSGRDGRKLDGACPNARSSLERLQQAAHTFAKKRAAQFDHPAPAMPA